MVGVHHQAARPQPGVAARLRVSGLGAQLVHADLRRTGCCAGRYLPYRRSFAGSGGLGYGERQESDHDLLDAWPWRSFFGIGLLKQRFPHARAVARPDIVEAMRHELDPPYFNSFWNSRFPGQLPEQLAVPETLERNTIELEGHELVLVDTGYTDTALATSLHVPSIDLVVAGDVAYNGVHPYMAEGNPQTWPKWIAALDKLESLKPRAVIAAHKRPENDHHPRIIA